MKNGYLKTVRQTLKAILEQHPAVVAKCEAEAEARGKALLARVRGARRLKEKEKGQEI